MSGPSTRLVVRLGPDTQNESLAGYILRLSAANGYTTPLAIVRMANLPGWHARRPCTLDGLAALVAGSATLDELQYISYWPALNCDNKVRFGESVISPAHLDLSHSKLCPACLSEGLPISRLWDCRAQVACPKHGNYLIDKCHRCRKRLTWSRPAPDICSCGASLVDGSTIHPASPNCLELARVIEQLGRTLKHELGPGVAPVDTLDGVAQLIWWFGTTCYALSNWRSTYISKPEMEVAKQVAEEGSRILLNWPSALHEWISRYHRLSSTHVGLGAEFGSMLHRMRAGLDRESLTTVMEEVRRHLAKRICYPTKSWAYFHTDSVHQNVISGTEAARRLKTRVPTIAQLIKAGELVGESRRMGKRHLHLVDVKHLNKFEVSLNDTLSSADAVELLGISDRRLASLRISGLVTAVKGVGPLRSAYRYKRNTIFGLVDSLRIKARRTTVPLIELTKLPAGQLSVLLGKALQGSLPIFLNGGSQDAGLLSQLGLELAILQTRHDSKGEELIGVRAAARLLHLNVRMIPLLVRAGCLESRATRPDHAIARISIPMQSIRSFNRRYCVSKTLAQSLSTSPRAVARSLVAAGIHPIISSDSARGISAVWRLSDLRRAPRKILRAAAKLLSFTPGLRTRSALKVANNNRPSQRLKNRLERRPSRSRARPSGSKLSPTGYRASMGVK